MKQYIGITVGPIYDTIRTASTPASLWFASAMFSDITRRICKALHSGAVFGETTIYTPYYDETITLEDGVGKFHDRIIFSCEAYDEATMQSFLTQICKETMLAFPAHLQNETRATFLEEYIQLKHIALTEEQLGGKNCILAISPYLDALELMKTFPVDEGNSPLPSVLYGENENIKKSALFAEVSLVENQLVNADGTFCDVPDIARSRHTSAKSAGKSSKYFAVLQADGDKMGAFLQTVSNEDLTAFSKICLDYAREAASMINEFGGTTIYAGGDDLLALTPVINHQGKSVFSLCQDINALFSLLLLDCDIFANREDIPTISFGISIQYNKHPLYEALAQGATQLFGKAKTGEKNKMAIHMQKHSGQAVQIVLCNKEYQVLEDILAAGNNVKENDKVVQSILYTLEMFREWMVVLDDRATKENLPLEEYRAAFGNLFDNEHQQAAKDYIGTICDIYYKYLRRKEDALDQLFALLRLKKFLNE